MEQDDKPRLSLSRILLMNAGFLGLQFSFGLQQSNMAPIYSDLGATTAMLPLLTLAGPVTGLVVQPLIGALSDRTQSRLGRRVPYFLAGAAVCSLGLAAMPFSPSLLIAAVLLWILDAANNVTMEPYRAYVSDRLSRAQKPLGFLTQSSFTGLAQTLSYIAPTLFVLCGLSRDAIGRNGIPLMTTAAFLVGAAVSVGSILLSVITVPELPAPPRAPAHRSALAEIIAAVRDMPPAMRGMTLMSLFQWYAMMCYWTYIVYSIAQSVYHAPVASSAGFRRAVLANGQVGAFYNALAAVVAFAMVPVARRFGAARLHAVALASAACSMLVVPFLHQKSWLFCGVIGIGVGWGSIMGNPYIILANAIRPEQTGVYMGIFNMFIVVPMILFGLTMPVLYRTVLHNDPGMALVSGGVCMVAASLCAWRLAASGATRG